jgi:CRP/FNR family transcriptional regulator
MEKKSMNVKLLLKKSDFFSEISDSAVQELSSIGYLKKFQQGDILFRDGEKGTAFFLLTEGRIKIYKSSTDGKEIILKLISPGEIFAEVVLFENDKYPVNASAASDSELFVIERKGFYSLLNSEAFRNDFMAKLMKKQRYLAERILYISAYDVEERFFRFLASHYGVKNEYDIDISKKEIAEAIGTIPETFSRLLMRLKDNGKINWQEHHLSVDKKCWEDLNL